MLPNWHVYIFPIFCLFFGHRKYLGRFVFTFYAKLNLRPIWIHQIGRYKIIITVSCDPIQTIILGFLILFTPQIHSCLHLLLPHSKFSNSNLMNLCLSNQLKYRIYNINKGHEEYERHYIGGTLKSLDKKHRWT